jgi:hypothetical protein
MTPEERMQRAQEYLEKHQIQAKVQAAVDSALATMSNDPMAVIAAALSPSVKGGAPPKKEEKAQKGDGESGKGKQAGKKDASPGKPAAAPAAQVCSVVPRLTG